MAHLLLFFALIVTLFSEEKKGCGCTIFSIRRTIFRIGFGFALYGAAKPVFLFFRAGRVSEKALAVKAGLFCEGEENRSACKAKHPRASLTALSFSDGAALPKVRKEPSGVRMLSRRQRLYRFGGGRKTFLKGRKSVRSHPLHSVKIRCMLKRNDSAGGVE